MRISTKLAKMLVDFWRCNRSRLRMYEASSRRARDLHKSSPSLSHAELIEASGFSPLETVQLAVLRKTCSAKRKLLVAQLKKENWVAIWNAGNMISHIMDHKAYEKYKKAVRKIVKALPEQDPGSGAYYALHYALRDAGINKPKHYSIKPLLNSRK